ncbi:Uncharacterized membrane-anchored protein [Raineyella antarctica]|uniref:Uncharacterized membrane-anchored protein n=1 Tax=Raineyella antarctica TaxID=1577474 RepID=A0A1G6HFP5_9ACTN|nr:hypothetical protein [Raineyella antarctica]SDB92983.1 Uncharacterized membrane-anchored protein [Raineyella antarctica]
MTLLAEPTPVRTLRAKVPAITALFWITKILTTALGESASDYLVNAIDPYLAVIAGFALFVLAIVAQLRARCYRSWLYWATVGAVALFGTMAADVVHTLGVPYGASVAFYAACLGGLFVAWRRVEGCLDIHSITTTRREVFYWGVVLSTFALGTAAGDLTAHTFHLGFLASGVLFGVVFAVPMLLGRAGRLGKVAAFWAAYVFTRPFGASFADWLGKEPKLGGIGWGDLPVSAVLLVLILACVALIARREPEGAVAGDIRVADLQGATA